MLASPVAASKLVPPPKTPSPSTTEQEESDDPTKKRGGVETMVAAAPSAAATSGSRRNSAAAAQQDSSGEEEYDNEGRPISGGGVSTAASAASSKRFVPQHPGPNCDWTPEAKAEGHLFAPTSGSSGDSCYLDRECKQNGSRLKCVSCHVLCHQGCLPILETQLPCRQTFRDCVRKYREQTTVKHHFVQRKNLKGKCKHCGKAFASKLGFGTSKEIVGLSCTWCKYSYHSKDNCLKALENDSVCDLGQFSRVILPPSWIVKRPRKDSFKSSLKDSPNKARRRRLALRAEASASSVTATTEEDEEEVSGTGLAISATTTSSSNTTGSSGSTPTAENKRAFMIKPIPSNITPVLVFLNPKSGGNQGVKLMQKFQWLLNPRQVFDLTQHGGPMPAVEMFCKVPNLKILVCGGDGTVGWLLSTIDKLYFDVLPAVSVLPLGTGNDLSRSLGWGGGYMDEPISKILNGLENADEVKLDRWRLKVSRNGDFEPTEKRGQDDLPINVVNNYFSFGVDAQIALQFHEAREANPHKFNSRIRNKMYYGQAGSKDLLLRKWKDLSDDIEVICDGVDITPKLREIRVHSVLFANITSFSAGTRPWNPTVGEQRMDDGLIEVIGLTTYKLPLLQAGGHGHCITQCKQAVIKTKKTIPMQVDGEANRLNPATIELSLLNQVRVLAKRKGSSKSNASTACASSPLELSVSRLKMSDYTANHLDKERLRKLASPPICQIDTNTSADLEQVRSLIKDRIGGSGDNWCFIDSVTALRFFRIDRAQENLHYVLDICDNCILYILEDEEEITPRVSAEEEVLGTGSNVDKGTKENVTEDHRAANGSHSKGNDSSNDDDVFIVECKHHAENNNTLDVVKGDQADNVVGDDGRVGPSILQVPEKTTEGILKAARLGDLNMLTELYDQGYSLLSIDETGKTGLHYAARFGHKDIVKFVIGKAPKCLLDMQDYEKAQTALHKAAGYKRRTICCMLVAAGASLLIQDTAKLTPRQLAVMADDEELASYLESQEEIQRVRAHGGAVSQGDFETPV